MQKTYVKNTQTRRIPTAQQSTQYSLTDIGVTPPPATPPIQKREQGVQCNLIGGQLILDEEESSDDEDEFYDNPDVDPDWLPGDEDSDNDDDDLVEMEDTM